MRFYCLPCMTQLPLLVPAQHGWPLPWVPTDRDSQGLRAVAGSQPWSLGAFGWADGTGRADRPSPACCPWAPTTPNHHGTWTATNTLLHFQNHTKIKENGEILTRLVTIFHPPFRFLQHIKHVGFNSTLHTYLQVCRCSGPRPRVLTKASQREREVHYKQQQSYTTPNEFQMISSLEALTYSKTQSCYF